MPIEQNDPPPARCGSCPIYDDHHDSIASSFALSLSSITTLGLTAANMVINIFLKEAVAGSTD